MKTSILVALNWFAAVWNLYMAISNPGHVETWLVMISYTAGLFSFGVGVWVWFKALEKD